MKLTFNFVKDIEWGGGYYISTPNGYKIRKYGDLWFAFDAFGNSCYHTSSGLSKTYETKELAMIDCQKYFKERTNR